VTHRGSPVLLPQRTMVTVRKVWLLAQYLRARRQGQREPILWQRLPQADRDWWFHEALRHLEVAELVLGVEVEVPPYVPAQALHGGAVSAPCQT
jgi:hypothetical protein